jgi:REP element-mobilizing transposase RayT
MARQPRVEYEGAWYHVMSRGDHRERIFEEDEDRRMFLRTLGEVCGRTGWRVAAYVLMGNHFHLQMQTPEANLVEGMKWFLGAYTQRFNARHRLCGHLFQGRYKAIPVEEGDYLLRVSDYIHLNPVRARLLDQGSKRLRLRDYPWSSLPAFVGQEKKPPGWLEGQWAWSWAGLEPGARSTPRRYEARLEHLAAEERASDGRHWAELRRGWCVGGEDFAERLLEHVGQRIRAARRDSYAGQEVLRHDQAAAEALLQKCLKRLKMGEEQLTLGPKGMKEKAWLAWALKRRTMASRRWISQRLGMGVESRVSRAVSEVEADRRLTRKLQKSLLTDLTHAC